MSDYTAAQYRWRAALRPTLAEIGTDIDSLPWRSCSGCGCLWGQVHGAHPDIVELLDRAVEMAAPLLAGDVHELCDKRL